jgi:hypothetical protein
VNARFRAEQALLGKDSTKRNVSVKVKSITEIHLNRPLSIILSQERFRRINPQVTNKLRIRGPLPTNPGLNREVKEPISRLK